MSLSKEKRQEFLDLIWKGKNVKEAYETCGISFDEANGILALDIKTTRFLRKETI